MKPVLGCIADDYTGATDIASMLREGGMQVLQHLGVPVREKNVDADAVIIALKSRSIPKKDAVRESIEALRWLGSKGCKQYYFKYCSTFDSTDQGNIGPVIEAMLSELGLPLTIACPAYPENGRTVFNGHLFVGQKLLSESGMQNHPLNPMTDSNLVNVLQRQTSIQVGLLDYQRMRNEGPEDILHELNKSGMKVAITDAIVDEDLIRLIDIFGNLTLLTGGAGLAAGLPDHYRNAGLISSDTELFTVARCKGYSAVISGSCSDMTLKQVSEMKKCCDSFKLDAETMSDETRFNEFTERVIEHVGEKPILIYSSDDHVKVQEMQSIFGRSAGLLIENALAKLAQKLVENGVDKLVVAGGETAGAIVKALGIESLKIGQVIELGVPWTQTTGTPTLNLALKSGNFGKEDFFLKAFEVLHR